MLLAAVLAIWILLATRKWCQPCRGFSWLSNGKDSCWIKPLQSVIIFQYYLSAQIK
jgi:hypothetical protein